MHLTFTTMEFLHSYKTVQFFTTKINDNQKRDYRTVVYCILWISTQNKYCSKSVFLFYTIRTVKHVLFHFRLTRVLFAKDFTIFVLWFRKRSVIKISCWQSSREQFIPSVKHGNSPILLECLIATRERSKLLRISLRCVLVIKTKQKG